MKKSKLLGVLFAVITILFCSLFAFAVDYPITPGVPITAILDYSSDISFMPEVTGTYKVTFKGDADFQIYYDEDYDCDENYYFEIVENFEADEYYNFYLSSTLLYGVAEPVNVEVTVTSLLCEHKNTSTTPAEDFTCNQDGATEKIACSDCGWVLKESFVRPARHLDADNDYVCDVCSEEAVLISDTYDNIYYDYETDTETHYTTKYKFYANGDLYIDGSNARFSVYSAEKLYDFFKKLYNPDTDDYDLKVRNVYVGKDMAYFDVGSNYGVERFIVDPENKEYSSDSYGILFSKDGKELLAVPSLWKETSYDIPEGVESIDSFTFTNAKYLETVTIPSSVKYISSYTFNTSILTCDETVDGLVYIGDALIEDIGEEMTVAKIREGTRIVAEGVGYYDNIVYEIPESLEFISDNLCTSASAFIVDENNNYFADIDGVLFNKDKSILITYPGAREDSSYVIPAGVKEIADYAFSYSDIKQVELPDGLERVGASAFSGTKLQAVELPLSLKEIDDFAFATDETMKAVVLHKNIVKLGYQPFNCDTIAILNPECDIKEIGYISLFVGYNGSTAEKFANERGFMFATLGDVNGDNHQHIYIPKTITPATCTANGEEFFSCPCGNTETYTRAVEAMGHDWYYMGDERYCINCDEFEIVDDDYDCECECHSISNKLEMFFFKIKVFFWKIFKPGNKYCDCGAYHW